MPPWAAAIIAHAPIIMLYIFLPSFIYFLFFGGGEAGGKYRRSLFVFSFFD